ncbi:MULTISPECIES: GTPase Era [unclassified Helicobacter]|uniref:GTPase Era n=1 Tax=unclassified Helicobacter TaxID=2593540 RepID=UPI003F8A9C01
MLPSSVQRAGFVGILGRPNAGKSSLLNHLAGQNLALISHKANATRNKMHFIIPHTTREGIDTQIIFVDTPGIHQREKLLNQFMLEVALKVMKDCDLCVFMASVHDDLSHYEKFLALYQNALESTAPRKHILVLSKIDTATHEELLSTIDKYNKFSEHFYALIPISTKKPRNINELLEQIAKRLPESSALFDEDDITTHTMREIAKEMIRQSIFSNLSDEIPYESDVILTGFAYKLKRVPLAPMTFASKSARQRSITKQIAHISANIYVLKNSQKKIIIGSEGATLKRIGMQARASIEEILGTQVFLCLSVIVDSKWVKNKKNLKNFGYNFEL